MSREVEDRWNSSSFESDSLPCPVEIFISEVFTAEQCSVISHKTFPSQGTLPLSPALATFGKLVKGDPTRSGLEAPFVGAAVGSTKIRHFPQA